MSQLKAVLYDRLKNKEATYTDEYPYGADNALYQWLEGNYSCDDNRGAFVAEVLGEPDPDYPCGEDKVELRALYLDGVLIGKDEND